MSTIPFYLTFIFHAAFCAGFALGGVWNFAVPALAFVVLPLADLVVGRDHRNYTSEEYDELENRWSFRIVTILYGILQVVLTVFGAWAIATQGLSWLEIVGVTLSIGTINGNGINFSHELLHKNTKFERFCANISLMVVSYMHFIIEHTSGHHVRIATPADPASSRKNESFYRFFPRTVIGGLVSAWHIETTRLQKRNLAVWSHHNKMLWYVLLPTAFCAALVLAFGWGVVPYFVLQSLIAIQLLELVNYIEHYGLVRKEVAPGRYESVKPMHSWEARETLTNFILIKLQRHADHHVNPLRRYQSLRVFDESPQMPTGYTGMMLLSLVPPLFFRVVNPRLEAHERLMDEARLQDQDNARER
jgi:alkane 1-monooxygenase